MVNNNSTEYKLRCEYYQEIGVFGGGCNAPEGCPYNLSYQFSDGNQKGCKIVGLVPISDLSEDLKKQLDKKLVKRVEVSKISLPIQE